MITNRPSTIPCSFAQKHLNDFVCNQCSIDYIISMKRLLDNLILHIVKLVYLVFMIKICVLHQIIIPNMKRKCYVKTWFPWLAKFQPLNLSSVALTQHRGVVWSKILLFCQGIITTNFQRFVWKFIVQRPKWERAM